MRINPPAASGVVLPQATGVADQVHRDSPFVDACERIQKKITSHSGVDICLRHHFFKNKLCASALFIEHVPSFKVTREIEDLFPSSWQVVCLGETTVRGGGIPLFDGIHVSLFHKSFSNPEWLERGTPIPLKVITGVHQIDVFIRTMLDSLLRYSGVHMPQDSTFLETLTETVQAIRTWLDAGDRISDPNSRFGSCTVKTSDHLRCALNTLYEKYRTLLGDDVDRGVRVALDSAKMDSLNIVNERQTKKYKDFSPLGEQFSVSKRLHWYSERNQKQLDYINTANGFLSGVSVAMFAVVYKALADLVFVPSFPLCLVVTAVIFNYLAALWSLLSFRPVPVPVKKKPPKEPPPQIADNAPLPDFGDFKFQRKYRRDSESIRSFAELVNSFAPSGERVDLGNLDFVEAGEVTKMANQIYHKRIRAGISISFYIVAVIFYAIASAVYGCHWKCG